MKNQIAVISVCLGVIITSQASQLTGLIDFDGNVTYNGPIATTTGITAFSAVTVSGATGSFAGETGFTPVTFTPFLFSSIATTPIELWSFTDTHGNSFAFELSSVLPLYVNHSLTLSGDGTLTASGYDPTPGFWTLSSSGSFRFTSETEATPTPDGAMTAFLLGLGVVSLNLLRYSRFICNSI